MKVDTFIEIGSQHKICEDYILSGYDPHPYIILADGCSSSKHTDIGARILCHLAKTYLTYTIVPTSYIALGSWVINTAKMLINSMNLNLSCLDSTLIVSYYVKDLNNIFIHVYGDGCIILKHEVKLINYENNAPYYLTYMIDKKRNNLYKEMNNSKTIRSITKEKESTVVLKYNKEITFIINANHEDVVLISSDGLESFISLTTSGIEPIHPIDIISSFISFKNTKGSFLERRLNKQMKMFNKQGVTHYDDLSVGAFLNK